MLADQLDYIIGVDPHRDSHALAVVQVVSGVAMFASAVNARRAGLCQLRDLLITAPEPLRSELRPLTRARLLQRLATTRAGGQRDPELRGSARAALNRSPGAADAT